METQLDYLDTLDSKLSGTHEVYRELLRNMGGEEMAKPQVVNSGTSGQLHLDFSERFADISWKEADRAVVAIIKGLIALGLDEQQVDFIMSTIGDYAPCVAGHASKE